MSDCSGHTGAFEEARQMSKRGEDWQKFAGEVLEHIETYTVPQYGDKGEDQASDFTAHDHMVQVRRYVNRYGKNSRPGQDILDLRKAAHYLQMAAMELAKELEANNATR